MLLCSGAGFVRQGLPLLANLKQMSASPAMLAWVANLVGYAGQRVGGMLHGQLLARKAPRNYLQTATGLLFESIEGEV